MIADTEIADLRSDLRTAGRAALQTDSRAWARQCSDLLGRLRSVEDECAPEALRTVRDARRTLHALSSRPYVVGDRVAEILIGW